MKITSLVFIFLALIIAFDYTEVFIMDNKVIAGVFALWLICIYIGIHLKNKERNIPRPVYLTQ